MNDEITVKRENVLRAYRKFKEGAECSSPTNYGMMGFIQDLFPEAFQEQERTEVE